MTIRRQYSLPNCKLILEGWSNEPESADKASERPLLTMVVNAECHFAGYEKPLVGGREFVESLVKAASRYAQEFLSGIPHPPPLDERSAPVQIGYVQGDIHRLTCRAPESNGHQPADQSMQIDLKTVQFFDLVEAVDQMLADSQTLPDFKVNLVPVRRRHVAPQEPVTKRALPAAIGVSGLAVAAIAIFFVPPPDLRRTGANSEASGEQSTEVAPDAASSSPAGSDPPDAPEATLSPSPDAQPSPADEASPADATSPQNSSAQSAETNSPSSDSTPAADTDNLDVLIEQAPTITDPARLEEINRELFNRIDQAWRTDVRFSENLVYRVGVNQNGDIVGYRYENDAALTYVNDIPLPDLRSTPVSADTTSQNSIAQFRVVFRPNGALEVSPWYGTPRQ
ncbi:MAG: DUF4335 domain-containing protein [Elainellaceae cyanobacterium]